MVDFITASSSLFVTFMVLVGFVGIAGVLVFGFGSVFLFWIKDAFINDKKTLGLR